MPIKHRCLGCNVTLQIPDSLAGQARPCPRCQTVNHFAPPPAPELEREDPLPRVRASALIRRQRSLMPAFWLGMAGLVGLTLWAAAGPLLRHRAARAFDGHVEAWGDLRHKPVPDGTPYLRGKVIIVRAPVAVTEHNGFRARRKIVQAARVDDDHWELPGDLRADEPDEVGTVVVCERANNKVGVYVRKKGSRGPVKHGYRHTVVLRIFDLASGVMTGTVTINGAEPSAVLDHPMDDGVGERPDIVRWLEALPRR